MRNTQVEYLERQGMSEVDARAKYNKWKKDFEGMPLIVKALWYKNRFTVYFRQKVKKELGRK